MDDAKRFLRYLVPGNVFGILCALLLWVLRPDWVEAKLPELAQDTGIGLAVAGLLGSGAIGFLFSVVHHRLHWMTRLSTIDHTELIRRLIRAGRIQLLAMDPQGKESTLAAEAVDRRLAWSILTSVWHRSPSDDAFKSAESKAGSLIDTAHSLGTARVAALGALVVALAIAARVSAWDTSGWPLGRFVLAVLLGIGVVVVLWGAYRQTGDLAQAVIEQVFAHGVFNGDPVEVRVRGTMLPNDALMMDEQLVKRLDGLRMSGELDVLSFLGEQLHAEQSHYWSRWAALAALHAGLLIVAVQTSGLARTLTAFLGVGLAVVWLAIQARSRAYVERWKPYFHAYRRKQDLLWDAESRPGVGRRKWASTRWAGLVPWGLLLPWGILVVLGLASLRPEPSLQPTSGVGASEESTNR